MWSLPGNVNRADDVQVPAGLSLHKGTSCHGWGLGDVFRGNHIKHPNFMLYFQMI